MRIRKRDGSLAEVADSHILQDGESLLVDVMFMDAARSMVHDGNGGPVGQRPGFLYADDERAAQAVADAYAQYDAEIGQRWRQGPGQRSSQTRSAPQTEPQTFANPEAARVAAYAEYSRTIQERWRR